jgi:hypothetical protein
MRQLLHSVLVATKDPFVDTSIAVHGQIARVPFPHEHGWVTLPPLCGRALRAVRHKSPFTCKNSPYLVRFTSLFPQAAIV